MSNDRVALARACVRCFRTPAGKQVLTFLQNQRLRVLGTDATDSELRFLEGQRALVAQLVRLIEEGKAPQKIEKGEYDG